MHDDLRIKKYSQLEKSMRIRELEIENNKNKQVDLGKISKKEEQDAIDYNPSLDFNSFFVYKVINHKRFGFGRVVELLPPNKIKIFFLGINGELILRCNKGINKASSDKESSSKKKDSNKVISDKECLSNKNVKMQSKNKNKVLKFGKTINEHLKTKNAIVYDKNRMKRVCLSKCIIEDER